MFQKSWLSLTREPMNRWQRRQVSLRSRKGSNFLKFEREPWDFGPLGPSCEEAVEPTAEIVDLLQLGVELRLSLT